MRTKLLLTVLAAFALPMTAQAATYSAAADFASYGTSGNPWTYGYGVGGSSFTAFSTTAANCATDLPCYTSGDYRAVGKNVSGATITPFGTTAIPNDALWIHPGNGGGASNSIVQFTAATAGSYTFSGDFTRLSTDNSGDGVIVSIFSSASPTALFSDATSLTTNLAYGLTAAFSGSTTLAAGETLSFVVSNGANNAYGWDSTGLRASITSTGAVPETATWAMMLVGFGTVGFGMRTARRRTVAIAA
jgi:hypothetical protein